MSEPASGDDDGATGAPAPSIDPALVRAVEQELHRDDIDLTIATPHDYAAVEEASRGACIAGDVLTPLTAELISWFVDRNPCGPGFVVIARPPGERRILGHFVFYPWTVRLRSPASARGAGGSDATDHAGAVEGVAAESGHSAASQALHEATAYIHIRLWVSVELRRRGVFLSMTRFGLELVRRMGVGLAYTVPNQRSAPGFLKLGECLAGELPFWVRPLLPGWAAVAGSSTRGIEVERREAFDDSFDAARDAAMPAAATAWSPRRAALLNWRYPERPDFDYEIRYLHRAGTAVGYLVTRRMRIKRFRTLAVCDCWTAPGEERALRAGLDDAARAGERVDVAVAFGGNVAGTLRTALRAAAFVPCPKPLQPQPVAVIGGGIGDGAQRVELPPFDGWYITPCDWDVF
ncbi:MAG: hypothetical protein PVJ49_08680 [Acidobacteriota bacterium]